VHEPRAFLESLAIALGAAGITTAIGRRLRVPLILAYLVAGLLIGPHSFRPLAADPAVVRQIAELGVVLLMFSLGLGFGVRHLIRAGAGAAIATMVEVGLSSWLGYLVGRLVGWSVVESAFAGACLAVSSTMVVGKTFAEMRTRGEHQRIVLAILVVEDLVAVLLIAVMTAVGQGAALDGMKLATMAGKLGLFLVALVVLGLLIVPRFIHGVARLRDSETLLMAGIGVCFLIVLVTMKFDYSVALGAFLAGSLAAESGAGRALSELVRPLRDVFAGIFFVAVGMLIDPVVVAQHWPKAALLAVALVVGKTMGVTLGVFLTGHGVRRAVPAGLTMAQIGEFSILIASVGLATRAAGESLFVSVIAVAALTSATTPWLARRSGAVAAWIEHHLPRPLQTFGSLYGSWMENLRRPQSQAVGRRLRRGAAFLIVDAVILAAICAGAAAQMRPLARGLAVHTVLTERAASAAIIVVAVVLALPLIWGIVRRAQGLAHTIADTVFPASAEGTVDLAAAPRRSLVQAVHTIIALAVGIPLVALTQPMLPPLASLALLAGGLGALLIAFWRGAANLQGHVRAGTEVVLEALGRQTRSELPSLEDAKDLLPGLGTLIPWRVRPDSPAVGKTLGELDLRARTGATVLAVFRPSANVVAPSASERIAANDVLAMTGSSDAVDAASRLLSGEDAEPETP